MRTFSRLLFALFLATVFFSCKKDGASSSNSILGTWNIVSDELKEYENGTLVSDNVYTGADADEKSIRFDDNNTAFVVGSDNTASSEAYTYDAQSKLLLINDETFVIRTLTSSSLVMFNASPTESSTDRDETIITWKR